MGTPALSDELAQQAADTFRIYGEKAAAADFLGIKRNTFCSRLNIAARRGMLGPAPTLPGFSIKQISSNIDGQWVKQTHEPGDVFELPAGHVVKGVSALLDSEHRVVQQWVKTRQEDSLQFEQAIRDAFDAYEGHAVLPPAPVATNADLLTIYPIADLHLGLFSWARETGTDYDLKIASELLRSSMADLVARSANSEQAVVLDLGDYFHSDNSRNQTAKSGNPLDIDSRYAKVIQVGVELAIHCIDMALQKHQHVAYRKLPGNHDDETSLMLSIALAAWFRGNERVSIDTDPSRFFMRQHGSCMIAATHGDMLKMGNMAGFMAARWPKEWGATEHRHAYTGHIHNEKVRTDAGVRIESFNTLAAKDAWHSQMGYTAPRNMVAITMHKTLGEISRLTVSVPR